MDEAYTDSSASAHTVTAVDTFGTVSTFGIASYYFNADGDTITVADNADFNFGANPFTIDGWFYFDGVDTSKGLFAQYDAAGNQKSILLEWIVGSTELRVYWSTDGTANTVDTFSFTPVVDTWYHIAVVRTGNELKVFVNGTQVGITEAMAGTLHDSTDDFTIGYVNDGAAERYLTTGKVDEFRITKGLARWTSDFTVPDEPSPVTANSGVSSVYEIASPYAAADLADIQYAQTADIMYITHKDYEPYELQRTDHDAWTIEAVDFIDGPYLEENLTATTLDPDGTTGNVTVVASAVAGINGGDGFQSTDDGRLIRYHDGDNWFWFVITAINSTTSVDATIQYKEEDPDTVTMAGHAATERWRLGTWSGTTGYPGAVSFYEQRLAFAGSTDYPQSVWLSVSQDYDNMMPGADADDALSYTIATDEVNAIKWMAAHKVLSLGTSGGVFSLSSGTAQDALTPTNVIVKRETTYGSSDILPVKIGNFQYYVQRDTETLRELSFDFDIDSYKATNISILSEHILDGGIVEMAYQQSPNNVLWCVLNNGELATMTREIDQEVAAWASQTTGGTATSGANQPGDYENVAVIPATTATEGDEVWFIVNRTIGDTTKRYVEYLSLFDWGSDDNDAFHVHSGLTYEGPAVSALSGLDHLEGETVDVYGDGAAMDQEVVTSGAITTSLDDVTTAVTVAQVGLPYTSTLKTLPPEIGSSIGTSQGMAKRINNIIVRVLDTREINIGDTDTQYDQNLDEMTTGDVEHQHNGGWDTQAQVVVTCDTPTPCHILAVIKQLTTEDR